MSKIKVILWDVDGTLLNFEASERVAIRKCFAHFGLGECTDAMLESSSPFRTSLTNAAPLPRA